MIKTPDNQPCSGRWPAAKAADWYRRTGWLCGFNYLPAGAVNFVEMWQAGTFDETAMARELALARAAGFNSLRTNLSYVVWRHGPGGMLNRLERFLDLASAHGLAVMLCLFDDCGFGGKEPRTGPQPAPVPGVHNSRAVASPGRAGVLDRTTWPGLEDYVRQIISHFATDPRVAVWDIYNEPGNRSVFAIDGETLDAVALEQASHALLQAAFAWARSEAPAQPLTCAAWRLRSSGAFFDHPTDVLALALSDVISFHAYCGPERLAGLCAQLAGHARPVLCTEWLARPLASTIAECLPVLHETGTGAYQWGLVNGRTQTHLPWPAIKAQVPHYDEATALWFHDLFHGDGTPYCKDEITLIARLCKSGAQRQT